MDMGSILKQVEEQKKRAHDLQMPKMLEDLYDDFKYMPYKIQNKNELWKDTICEAKYLTDDQSNSPKILVLLTNGNKYIFEYINKSCPDTMTLEEDCIITGGYELLFTDSDGNRLLGISFDQYMDCEFPASCYKAVDVIAFKEGIWIDDFKSLHAVYVKDTEKRREESDAYLADILKTNFTIK